MSRHFGLILLFQFFYAASWAQIEDEKFNGPHIDKLILQEATRANAK